MTTITNFVPSPLAPFQFSPVLDGDSYNAIATWNVSGQRWYVNLYTQAGVRVFTLPLISSPPVLALETLSWANGTVTATTAAAHGFAFASTVAVVISGVVPEQYNTAAHALITGVDTFTYPLAGYPGLATALGIASEDISITAGYFDSTLVYRENTQQFEVSP